MADVKVKKESTDPVDIENRSDIPHELPGCLVAVDVKPDAN